MNVKIITNIFYQPDQKAKALYDSIKEQCVFVNGGNSLMDSDDPWVKANVVSETDVGGKTIGYLNDRINEWTAIWYAWMHPEILGDPEYVGFQHYRRLFDLKSIEKDPGADAYVTSPIPMLFCVNEQITSGTVYEGYALCHHISDYELMKDAVCRAGYKEDFEEWENQTALFAPCCMFVAKKQIFHDLCKFVYPILLPLTQQIDVSGRDNYQKRALAFLGERLCSFFFWRLQKQGYDIRTAGMLYAKDFKPADAKDARGCYDD